MTKNKKTATSVAADHKDSGVFTKVAGKISKWAGSPSVFIGAFAAIVLWAVSGPLFGFSDTWQLVVNTSTTIITFLMVFLIQNTQNRDTAALQIKLDELLRVTEGAHTSLLDLEEMSEDELSKLRSKYEKIAALSRKKLHNGEDDTHVTDVPEDK